MPDQPDDVRAQGDRFTKLMESVERLARAAGVTREQYLMDIIEGRRPKISPDDERPARQQVN